MSKTIKNGNTAGPLGESRQLRGKVWIPGCIFTELLLSNFKTSISNKKLSNKFLKHKKVDLLK